MFKHLCILLLFMLLAPLFVEGQTELTTFFGPEVFVRERGKPVIETIEFSTGGFQTPFILHLTNGDDNGKNRVSSAKVWLNGELLFSPSDFSQQVSGYDIEVALTEPSILKVRIASKPGSKLTIWIEGKPLGPPLNMILDEGNSVSYMISPEEGGEIELFTADGTHYTLEIPEDAILGPDEVTITMTSVIGIEGLPLSLSLLGAVRLEPDGLCFLRPVTLTIDLPPDTPLDEAIGFSYYSLDEEFYFLPIYSIDTTESSLVFQLIHFSDNGALTGTVSHCGEHGNPSSPEDVAKQKIVCILLESNLRQMLGASEQLTEDDLNQIHDILLEWFDNSVLPNLNAASNFESLEEAVKELYSWYETAQQFFDPVYVYFSGQILSAEVAINSVIDWAVSGLDESCKLEPDPCKKKLFLQDVFEWIGFAQLLASKYKLDGVNILVPSLEDFCDGIFYSQIGDIDIIQETATIKVGGEFKLNVTAESIGRVVIENPSLDWSSSDPSIASVDENGLVKGHAEGTVTITAMAGCGALDSATVEVIPGIADYRITWEESLSGIVEWEREYNSYQVRHTTKEMDYSWTGTADFDMDESEVLELSTSGYRLNDEITEITRMCGDGSIALAIYQTTGEYTLTGIDEEEVGDFLNIRFYTDRDGKLYVMDPFEWWSTPSLYEYTHSASGASCKGPVDNYYYNSWELPWGRPTWGAGYIPADDETGNSFSLIKQVDICPGPSCEVGSLTYTWKINVVKI